jgi:hypothetical protein
MTVRVFIGSSPDQLDMEAEQALEHSIRSRASEAVDIEWMVQSKDRNSFWHVGTRGWNTKGWYTPFSGFRWGVPARCNYEGRAIYCDVDMLCRDDIAKLFHADLAPDKILMMKQPGSEKFCVILFDCARCKPHFPPIEQHRQTAGSHRAIRQMIAAKKNLVQAFPPDQNWNCLDGEDYKDANDPRIKIVHFTHVPTQPHLPMARARLAKEHRRHWYGGTLSQHPRQDFVALWRQEYAAATMQQAAE